MKRLNMNLLTFDPQKLLPFKPAPRFHYTREEWLHEVARLVTQYLFEPAGYIVPPITLSVGIPHNPRGSSHHARAQCWSPQCSEAGISTIFVSPFNDEVASIVGDVVHELCHAVVGNDKGHGKVFAECAAKVGLVAPWTSTPETEEFKHWVRTFVVPQVGEYPHSKMRDLKDLKANPPTIDGTVSGGALGPTGSPKQSTRLLKLECPSCGCVVRITKKWLAMGAPSCGCPDHPEFQLAE
jgi:hypothetical protein